MGEVIIYYDKPFKILLLINEGNKLITLKGYVDQ